MPLSTTAFLGDFNTTETVHIPFNTFNSATPRVSATVTDLLASDIEIHKGGSVTQRASDAGVTVSVDFDGVTGNHMIHIDLSDDTDAGFYSSGSHYQVRVEGVTVATGTLNVFVGSFSIGCGVVLEATATSAQLVDDLWDEILTGATHNVATSAGKRLRELSGGAIHSGTAQAGTSTTITLDAAAPGADGVYNRNLLVVIDGTGEGQTRTIADYTSGTKVCVIDRDWRVTPDATSVYQILAYDTPLTMDHGLAQAGTATTITLRSYASAVDNTYMYNFIVLIAGTGRGQARLVGSYAGLTKVATISGDNWTTIPDTTSVYMMIPCGSCCTSHINSGAIAQINAEVDTGLTDYGANTTTPDAAGVAATLHGVTNGKIDTVDTVVDAIKVKTDTLPVGFAKNVAFPNFMFTMQDASRNLVTGATVTGTVSKDGATIVALTNGVVEVGSGFYKVDLTQAEMNVEILSLVFVATGANQRNITLTTDS